MSDVVLHYGAGQTYTTWADLRAAAQAINLAGTDQQGYIYLHENVVIGNSSTAWLGLGIDLTHFWRVMPAPGMGWRELNAGLDYAEPPLGIKITANAGSLGGLIFSNGFLLDGLILAGTNTTAGRPAFDLGRQFGLDTDVAGVVNCWITASNANSYPVIVRRSPKAITTLPSIYFRRNVLSVYGGTQPALVTRGSPLVESNTIVTPDPATITGIRIIVSGNNQGGWCRNNAILGGVLEEHTGSFSIEVAAGTESVNNHHSGPFTKTGTGGGYPAGGWIANLTTDAFDAGGYRPAAGGVLIGAASPAAENTPDINGSNSGGDPDVGAIQRNAAAPLAEGSITSVVTDGQQVSGGGTQTLAASGSASLVGSTSGGTVAVVLGAGTFTFDFENVSPGSYSVQVLLYNSEGAVTSLTGGSVVINNITGSPEGPEPVPPEGPPVISDVEASVISSTSADISVSTTKAGGTMRAVFSTSAGTPTEAAILAGTGFAATGSQSVTTAGIRTLVPTGAGMVPGAVLYPFALQEHPDGNSAVVGGDPITLPVPEMPPVMSGVVSFSAVTHNSYLASWGAGTNTPTRYEVSLNGGAWVNNGLVLNRAFTGRTPETTDTVEVRAVNADGISNVITGDVELPELPPILPPGPGSVLSGISPGQLFRLLAMAGES